MAEPTRTDYLPFEEFRKRMQMHIKEGWQPILPKQQVIIYPIFYLDFDKFVAAVAHELRHYIVYRSDGGKFARGIVRASEDLAALHKERKDAGLPVNEKVTIAAWLFRRKHATATSRYMMSIRFARTQIDVHVAEDINASAAITAQSDANLAGRILDWADQAGNEPKWNGDRKKRIKDWAEIARRLGYPRFMELWHYNRGLVHKYVQVQFEDKRKKMTNGKSPPFDGSWGAEPWRVYPFKQIMAECKRKTNIDDCYAHAANQLAQSEKDILAMIDDVYKAMIKYGSAHSQDFWLGSVTGSADAKYKDLAPFLKDLKKQLDEVSSLMGPYMKYSQYKPGIWSGF